MRPMIPVYAALALFAATQAGFAQTPAPAPAQVPAVTTAPVVTHVARPTRMEKRFNDANTTHDGKLTLDQAKTAKMTNVVKHFAVIDRGTKGYVTIDDLNIAAASAKSAKATTKPATTTKS